MAEEGPKSAKYSLGAVSRVLESTTVLLMLAPHTLMKDRIDPGKLGLIPSSSHCQKQGRKYAQGSMKSAVSHVSQAHLITSKQSLRAGVCQDSIKALSLPINGTTGTHTSFDNCSDRQETDSLLLALYIQDHKHHNISILFFVQPATHQESIQQSMDPNLWFTGLQVAKSCRL